VRIWRQDDRDVEASPGEIGEIGGRGASLMLGYFDDQSASEAAFNAQGWFMTGDLGWLDEAGYLHITGRKKDIIVRGGRTSTRRPSRLWRRAARGLRKASITGKRRSSGAGWNRNGPVLFAGHPGLRNFSR
jgi:hypothetical protein